MLRVSVGRDERVPAAMRGRTLVATASNARLLALALLAFATFFWGLGAPSLFEPDEGRTAEVARELATSPSVLIPTLNGIPYLDKPVLYFQMVRAGLWAAGDPEAGARLPSALFAAALLVLVAAFHRATRRSAGGALAAAVFCTMVLTIAFARTAIFDMTLTFFVCAAIFAGFLAEESGEPARGRWYAAGAVACGVATLIKGPVGFLVPGLVLGVLYAVERRADAIRRLFALRNLAIVLVLVLPWFLGVSWLHPDFPEYGIVHESLLRFTTNEFRRHQPIYFFPLVIALGCLPWSLVFAESVFAAWSLRSRWRRVDRLCVVWTLVVLVFFSLSRSKQPGYVLSACVPLALSTARVFEAALQGGERSGRIVARASLALAAVAGLVAVLLLACLVSGRLGRSAAALGALPSDALPRFLIGGSLVSAALAGLAIFGFGRRAPRAALAAFLALPLAVLPFGFPAYRAAAESRSSHGLAEALANLPPGTEMACVRCFPISLPFYLRHTLPVVTETGSELTSNYIRFALQHGAPWPESLVRPEALDAWLDRREGAVMLLARTRKALLLLTPLAAAHGARVEPLTDRYVGALIPAPEAH